MKESGGEGREREEEDGKSVGRKSGYKGAAGRAVIGCGELKWVTDEERAD